MRPQPGMGRTTNGLFHSLHITVGDRETAGISRMLIDQLERGLVTASRQQLHIDIYNSGIELACQCFISRKYWCRLPINITQ